ncbi:MAG: PPC domain-containing protein [Cyanobacteria bacterium P01_E01_bin.6]
MKSLNLWFIPGNLKGVMIVLTTISTVFFGNSNVIAMAPPQLAAQQASARTPQTITGELDQNSRVMEDDNNYYETHTFEGIAGETITIELTSDDFDTYLILESPTEEWIAQDDDGAGGTNAQIILTLPKTGTYQLIVNSYQAGETGDYQLEWRTATATEQPLANAAQLNQRTMELYWTFNKKMSQECLSLPIAECVVTKQYE